MTQSCLLAADPERAAAYLSGELADDEESLFEDHLFTCASCGEDVARAGRLMASIREASRGGHVLAVISRSLRARLLAEGVPIQQVAAAAGGIVHVTGLDPGARLLVVPLAGDFAGATRVDVRFENEWDGSVQEERGVALERSDELIIACGPGMFEGLHGLLRTRCRVRATDAPDRPPLAEYQLVIEQPVAT